MQETIWPRMGLHVPRAFVHALLTLAAGVLAGGCAPGGFFSTASPAAATVSPTPARPAAAMRETVRFAAAGPAEADESASEGIPFGIFGLTGRKLVPPFTAAMQLAQPEAILKDLAAAKARDARIIVNFVGGDKKVTDGGGHFDYNAWKSRVDRFRPMAGQLNAYVADGTLYAALIIDEPFVKNRWGGEPIPKETVDQMGQYLKSLFPDLPTTVGAAATTLQGYSWRYLDVAWAQYAARKGPATQFASSEAGAAQAAGLGLILGINITKGGDGSSGFGEAKEWSMSGKEITEYGHALLAQPYVCAFISWDYRPAVVDRPDVSAALQDLADAARKHPATPCRQKGSSRAERRLS